MINCPNCKSENITKMGIFGKDNKQRYGCKTCKELGKNPWTFYENQNKIKYVCDDPYCGHEATRKGIIRGKQRLYCKECDKTFYAPKVEEEEIVYTVDNLFSESIRKMSQKQKDDEENNSIDEEEEPIGEEYNPILRQQLINQEQKLKQQLELRQPNIVTEKTKVEQVKQKKEPKKERNVANKIREKKKLEKMNRGE